VSAAGSTRGSRIRRLAVLGAALLLICTPLTAGAEADAEDAGDDLLEMSIEELLDLEIVTASKKKQSLAEAPAFTHVITREQILRYGYRPVGEALWSLIGLYVSTDLVYGYSGVRGFARVVHVQPADPARPSEPSGVGVAFYGFDRGEERLLRKAVSELQMRYLP